MARKLRPEEVEWVVNDIAELGVRIKGVSYFLYKGSSIVYTGEDGPMHVRPVEKREFGEVCRPPNFQDQPPETKYTEGHDWSHLI